jgi:hypothetical protein
LERKNLEKTKKFAEKKDEKQKTNQIKKDFQAQISFSKNQKGELIWKNN